MLLIIHWFTVTIFSDKLTYQARQTVGAGAIKWGYAKHNNKSCSYTLYGENLALFCLDHHSRIKIKIDIKWIITLCICFKMSVPMYCSATDSVWLFILVSLRLGWMFIISLFVPFRMNDDNSGRKPHLDSVLLNCCSIINNAIREFWKQTDLLWKDGPVVEIIIRAT